MTATGPPGTGKAPGNKADRHMAHKVKRDEMILAARCRVENMIAKEREEGGR